MKKSLLWTALILTVALIAIYAFEREFSQVHALYEENEKIKGRTEEFKNTNEDLQKKIEALKKDELYIEKIVREELGMIKQGEKVYRFEE
jgi:cell division protein FtsB